ncbi:MAG: hypothetical protein II975_07725 [Bacteroidales bacterium]|nr:hypothetical protein [Bacteroidales bacterium]MBQ6741796.1 hypothetical protein [Bacteroidales bacterium]
MDYVTFKALRPASVIKPRDSRPLHRWRFSSVQWLPFRRGVSLCASLPSSSRFTVESIHPKQSASSTMSIYASVPAKGLFDRLQATQQHRSVSWCPYSHSRS